MSSPPSPPPEKSNPPDFSSSSKDKKSKAPQDDAPPPYTPSSSSTIPPAVPPHLIFRDPNAPPHLFHIYRDSLLNRDMTIMAPDKKSVAYTISTYQGGNRGPISSGDGPHMRIWRGPKTWHASTTPCGSATFTSPGHNLDVEFPEGRRTIFQRETYLGRRYAFWSPGFGARLVWEKSNMGTDLTLWIGAAPQDVGHAGTWVARYQARTSVDKLGVLEIVSWGIEGMLLDEIIIGAVAMIERLRN